MTMAPKESNPPAGFKLLAWEGVGLFVPQRWEIGRHEGNLRKGFYRVDDDARIVIQLRWWSASAPVPIARLVEQHARNVSSRRGGPLAQFRERPDLRLPAGPGDPAAVFAATLEPREGGAESEILALWQRPAVKRVVVARFLAQGGRPTAGQVRVMLSGLRLQGPEEERDWALHDLAFKTPPGCVLRQSHLYAGVACLNFALGRQEFALRRFSAADAVMGTAAPGVADLERWCRRIYALEFYDMRYQVAPFQDPLGRPGLRLTGSRRLLAPIEMKWLIPKHRRLPRRIDMVWDPAANKIYVLEIRRPSPALEPVLETLLRTLRMNFVPGAEPGPEAADTETDDRQRQRARSLQARVRRNGNVRFRLNGQGRAILTHRVPRPSRLRFLRLIGGLSAGSGEIEKNVELDLIGTLVWESCEREPRVCDLIESVRARFKISYREAELSVTEFIRSMGSRGLLSVVLPDLP